MPSLTKKPTGAQEVGVYDAAERARGFYPDEFIKADRKGWKPPQGNRLIGAFTYGRWSIVVQYCEAGVSVSLWDNKGQFRTKCLA